MTLSSAFNIINTSFSAIGVQSATIASNVANANVQGYSRQVANLGTTAYNGVLVYSVTREANSALEAQVNSATSNAAAQSAISDGLTQLAQTVDDSSTVTSQSGALVNGASPAAMLGNFASALAVYQGQPTNLAAAQAAVAAAKSVASALNTGTQTVTQVRTTADQDISQAVANVNQLLGQFKTVNDSIVSGLSAGMDVGQLEDQRDSLVTQISQQIGVNTSLNSNGSMSLFTDSGVTLFQVAPATITFSRTPDLSGSQPGAQVYVNGAPITGPSSNVPLQSGAISGLIQLRDTIAPQYQAQLDQIAGNLITAFQETDQASGQSGQPALPGLFTTPGATSVPASSSWTGIAGAITINPSVDPTQGGDATLLRDGGISDTTNPDYTYNSTGAASYTGRLQQLSAALTTPMSFAASAGLATSASLTDYSTTSVSWLQNANQLASSNTAYQQSLVSQSTSALSNATGVNLDAELTNMLTIESSYSASAKLMTTVDGMLKTLLNAV
jgi:flagellar hook-associated protein 1 FlgK